MKTQALHTTAEVATVLRTDANKVRQLIRRGELGAIVKYPNRKRPTYLIRDEDLDRWFAARDREAAA